jgi:hypothetical protein
MAIKISDTPQIETPRDEPDTDSAVVTIPPDDETVRPVAREPQLEAHPLDRQMADLRNAEVARQQAWQQNYAAQQEQIAQERREREQAEYDRTIIAIDRVKEAIATAERDYADALARGDWAAASEVNSRLQDAKFDLRELGKGAETYDEDQQQYAQEQPPPQQYYEPPQPQQPQYRDVHDYIERDSSFQNLTPRERSMLHQYPYLVSPQNIMRLQTIYNESQQQGIVRDSDEYFQFIAAKLQGGQPVQQSQETEQSAPQSEQQPKQRRAPVSAPVSRGTHSVTTGRHQESSSKIVLTPQQRDAARFSGVDEQTYARNLKRLQDLKRAGYYSE